MYKGNMSDFLDKLSVYLKENRYAIHHIDLEPFGQDFQLKVWLTGGNAWYSRIVTDTVDFEDQVYSHIKEFRRLNMI